MIFSAEDHQAMRSASDSFALATIGVEFMVESVLKGSPSLPVGHCPECRRGVWEPARTGSSYCSSGLHFEW